MFRMMSVMMAVEEIMAMFMKMGKSPIFRDLMIRKTVLAVSMDIVIMLLIGSVLMLVVMAVGMLVVLVIMFVVVIVIIFMLMLTMWEILFFYLLLPMFMKN
jgi:hypothetical protein